MSCELHRVALDPVEDTIGQYEIAAFDRRSLDQVRDNSSLNGLRASPCSQARACLRYTFNT